MPERRFDWFTLLAFLPTATFAVSWFYVRGFDGWGRLGAAPLLLIPVLVSIPVTVAGVLRLHAERTRGSIRTASVALTALAAVPLVWFLWRLLVS